MEVDLEQEITQLLLQVGDRSGHLDVGCRPGRIDGRDRVDGLDRLVGLLQQVTGQRTVGLASVPRAALSKRVDQFVQRHQFGGDGRGQLRDPQRREVVGLDHTVDLLPRQLDHLFVGQSQVVQDGDRLVRGRLDGELHVGQDLPAPALRHEERAALTGRIDREPLRVDDPNPGVDRIDTQSGESQVEKGDRRMDDDRDLAGHDPGFLGQQHHGAFGHHRRTGHGVDNGTVGQCGIDQVRDDGAVDLVERVGRLVVMIERPGTVDPGSRRMSSRTQEHLRRRSQEFGRRAGDQVGVRRSEADDVDSWDAGHRGQPPDVAEAPVVLVLPVDAVLPVDPELPVDAVLPVVSGDVVVVVLDTLEAACGAR